MQCQYHTMLFLKKISFYAHQKDFHFSTQACNLNTFQTFNFKSTGTVNTTLVIPRLVSASRLYECYQTIIFIGINRKARHLSARFSGLSPWTHRPTYQSHLHPLTGLTNVFTPFTFPLVLITIQSFSSKHDENAIMVVIHFMHINDNITMRT